MNNIRGIRFEIKNIWDNSLIKIFNGIDLNQYDIEIVDEDILFEEDINNKNIDNIFFINDKYYLIFLDAEFKIKNSNSSKILHFNDFLKSSYDLIILIYDSIYVDIYCKKINFIEIIKNNAEANNYKNIEYIDDDNDNRTILGI